MTQAASFSDKTNPMNPLIPRNLRRQIDGVTNGAPLPNPLTAVSFLPDSVRLPAEIEASYLNLLAMNSHILSPFARQLLLGNRNLPNLNSKRPLVPPPPPQTITNFPSQSSSSAIPSSNSASPSSSFSLPRPHEIEETGELVYSIVEGEKVMGFNVWGEVRLCLPHLLRFVLNDVDIDEIGQAISKLRIACTKCSPRQLAMLHGCNALPGEVTSCGLIRKSDAERMLKFLRSSRRRPTLADACPNVNATDGRAFVLEQTEGKKSAEERDATLGNFIDVRHDCFGTQRGRVYPHLYNSVTSPCIVCRTCNKLFSPQDFVGHTHSVNESDGCCHWGFDSTNWRSYLQLDIDSVSRQKKVKRESSESGEEENLDVRTYRALRDFKVKFLKVRQHSFVETWKSSVLFFTLITCAHCFLFHGLFVCSWTFESWVKPIFNRFPDEWRSGGWIIPPFLFPPPGLSCHSIDVLACCRRGDDRVYRRVSYSPQWVGG